MTTCDNDEGGVKKSYYSCDVIYGWPLRINLPLFSTVHRSNNRLFLSCRPFVVVTTFSTDLVGVEVTSVSWLGQLTVECRDVME